MHSNVIGQTSAWSALLSVEKFSHGDNAIQSASIGDGNSNNKGDCIRGIQTPILAENKFDRLRDDF